MFMEATQATSNKQIHLASRLKNVTYELVRKVNATYEVQGDWLGEC